MSINNLFTKNTLMLSTGHATCSIVIFHRCHSINIYVAKQSSNYHVIYLKMVYIYVTRSVLMIQWSGISLSLADVPKIGQLT